MIDYTIVLQAGGKSTRMGTDKALVPFRGATMIEAILEAVHPLEQDVVLISNRPADFERLGLPVHADVIPDWGALGGLYSAVYHAGRDWCLVLACDMPFVDLGLIRYMAGLTPGCDAVIPRIADDGFTEPFRAFYHKRCLPPIRAAIATGRRRVDSFFDDVRPRFVERAEIEPFDPELRTFVNVNTPEDLAAAEKMAS